MNLNEVVVDANVIVSALMKDSTARKILLGENIKKLFAPSFIKKELFKYLPEFSEKLNVGENELKSIMNELFDTAKIEIMPVHKCSEFMLQALQLSPDLKDAPYIALALKLNCPIWSQDKALKKQSVVKIYSTEELIFF